jgi:hypothetical protein
MRRYADPVEVRSHDAVPVGFRWRGRVYLVRAVLARWIERGSWWSGAVSSGAGPHPGVPRSVAGAVGALEREVWRVEAAAGSVVGVYDLVRDLPAADGSPAGDGSVTGSAAELHDLDRDRAARWRLVRSLD